MFGLELKFEPVSNCPSRGNRILRNDTTIPFHFHLEIIARQDRPAKIENISKPFGLEPVIEIVGDINLQDAGFAFAKSATAIDELLRDMADLGEVEMRRNLLATRQGEMRDAERDARGEAISVHVISWPVIYIPIKECSQSRNVLNLRM